MTSDRIGVVGFSMGAAWALWLSTQKPESVAAVVVFNGTWELDFARSQAAFLGHYAESDEWEPIDGVKKVHSFLLSAGRQVEFHFYPGVNTGSSKKTVQNMTPRAHCSPGNAHLVF